MADFRRAKIVQGFKTLLLENTDYTVAQLLHTVMRGRNIRGEERDSYFMSDEDMVIALENTINDINSEGK